MIKVSIEEYNQRLAESTHYQEWEDKGETASTKTTTKMIEKKPCFKPQEKF